MILYRNNLVFYQQNALKLVFEISNEEKNCSIKIKYIGREFFMVALNIVYFGLL
jgi:hypothetical protein